jgi:hypothetical protein
MAFPGGQISDMPRWLLPQRDVPHAFELGGGMVSFQILKATGVVSL